MSWSPIQGVLPTVPDQETEATQPYAPKRAQAPKCWTNKEEKKNIIRVFVIRYRTFKKYVPSDVSKKYISCHYNKKILWIKSETLLFKKYTFWHA
jgi:hypothetical protein